ncbi:cell division protein FtsZ [Pelagibacteraceae bacterium]|nr:cell division protein FtsZ [Pelagibacteraceae bacterium]
MTINISIQDVGQNLHPKITVLGVGGSGGNAVNNMINANLEGVDFLIANTDAQALQISSCPNKIQLGLNSTKGLGAGMRPDIGRQAAEEAIQDLSEKFEGSHMLFIAAGMGGGTGTGAAPVIAKLAREKGILTVGVVTKPFHFEGSQRMKLAEKGIEELQQYVDTLLTIPNQNLFRIANEKTTFSDAFKMADDVLYAGVRGVTDLMVQPGMINLDFSDIKTVMSEMGKAMMGTGEAQGEGRAIAAAEAAIANPLIDDVSLKGAKGLIINITGGKDITLYEVDEAANRIKQEIDDEANIIYGTTCDERLEGVVRVSIVATGIDVSNNSLAKPIDNFAPININNDIYKKDPQQDSSIIENTLLQESIDQRENIIIDDLNEISNEELIDDSNSKILNLEEETKTSEIEDINLKEKIQEENTQETTVSENENQIEINKNSDDFKNAFPVDIDKSNETSVRKLSLFDTLSTDSKSDAEAIENEDIHRTEPVFASNDVNIEESVSEENISNIDEKDEFIPEDTSSSETDEDFNQETEEELLDIPTFLRRQAN